LFITYLIDAEELDLFNFAMIDEAGHFIATLIYFYFLIYRHLIFEGAKDISYHLFHKIYLYLPSARRPIYRYLPVRFTLAKKRRFLIIYDRLGSTTASKCAILDAFWLR